MIPPKNTFSRIMLATSLALILSPSNAAVDCSREGVIYYLKQGISAEQVNQLCGDSPTLGNLQPIAAPLSPEKGAASQQNNDFLFFTSMIVADKVELKDNHLIYVKKDCIKYGEEVEEDVPDYVCGQFYTSIGLVGLKIDEAITGIPFFRDAELVVSGDIDRKVLDFEQLDKPAQKMMSKLFDFNPDTVRLPLRKDANPIEVGQRLKALGDANQQ